MKDNPSNPLERMISRARLAVKRHPSVLVLPVLLFVFLFMVSFMDNGGGAGSASDGIDYSMQPNYRTYTADSNVYSIGVISDMDKRSKIQEDGAKPYWESVFKKGVLKRAEDGTYSVHWVAEEVITSTLNDGGRSMELSELVNYKHMILSGEDRTGVVFDVTNYKAIPKYMLLDGDGVSATKGFKNEWSTVKDGELYFGSTGKEWTGPDGEWVNNNPQWIKILQQDGLVRNEDWRGVYEALRELTQTTWPGYMLHEAVNWNPAQRRWYFMPRRVSKLAYNDVDDEERADNLVIHCDEHFKDWQTTHIGPLDNTLGFSSFKFVPHRPTEVVALKTKEHRDVIATFITVFNLDGDVLLDETFLGDVKYEGVEFLAAES